MKFCTQFYFHPNSLANGISMKIWSVNNCGLSKQNQVRGTLTLVWNIVKPFFQRFVCDDWQAEKNYSGENFSAYFFPQILVQLMRYYPLLSPEEVFFLSCVTLDEGVFLPFMPRNGIVKTTSFISCFHNAKTFWCRRQLHQAPIVGNNAIWW